MQTIKFAVRGMRFFQRVLFVTILTFLLSAQSAEAKVLQWHYGVQGFSDTARMQMDKGAAHLMDSLLSMHPMLSSHFVVSGIANRHVFVDKTSDFYLLFFLCFLLGIIRIVDTRYFSNLWKAFFNPTLSNRQLKDQLQTAGIPNFLMNIFFTMSAGAYVYYAVKLYNPQRTSIIPPSLLVVLLILGMMIIYASKYVVVRFSGWAFKVEWITEHYLFNVFLINKILGIMLLPFVVIMAFAGYEFAQPLEIFSFFVITILFLNRYFRSWQVFGSFFQYSKFHFFMYLCASELLPLAVLMKLMVRGLLFY